MATLTLKKCIVPNSGNGSGKEERYIQDVAGVLFDKDGTLIDFHSMWLYWTQSFIDHLEDAIPAFAKIKDQFKASIGWSRTDDRLEPNSILASAPTEDILILAARQLCHTGIPWDDAWRQTTASLLNVERSLPWSTLTSPVPGVVETLRNLKTAGIAVAVVTADTRRRALEDLDRIGALDYVDVVLGHDSVTQSKPNPEMAKLACERLNISEDAAVIVGDTATDIYTGKRAGLRATIGVLSGAADSDELFGVADYLLDSVASIAYC